MIFETLTKNGKHFLFQILNKKSLRPDKKCFPFFVSVSNIIFVKLFLSGIFCQVSPWTHNQTGSFCFVFLSILLLEVFVKSLLLNLQFFLTSSLLKSDGVLTKTSFETLTKNAFHFLSGFCFKYYFC